MKQLSIFLILSFSILCFSFNVNAITVTLNNAEDSYVVEDLPIANFGSIQSLNVGLDNPDVETIALMKWDISSIPSTAIIKGAKLSINVLNGSSGNFKILQQIELWEENAVNWDNFSGIAKLLNVGILVEPKVGKITIDLNPLGVRLIQLWLADPVRNQGFSIRTSGTNDNIQISSSESAGLQPELIISYIDGPPTLDELQSQINAQQEQIDQLRNLLAGVIRTRNDIHFTGVNVRIKNGLGATNGNPTEPHSYADSKVNRLGNLIVGYDEIFTPSIINKTGSHNFVLGHGHRYSSYSGLVAGQDNNITAPYSSITGGWSNEANGHFSSVSGGSINHSNGPYASISGGYFNTADGFFASVNGGTQNNANGLFSNVSGGLKNSSDGESSSISGGGDNKAIGYASSVGGGFNNSSNQSFSTISAGRDNEANGRFSAVNGGIHNSARGLLSSIGGGRQNNAVGNESSISGGFVNTASGLMSNICGGKLNKANGEFSSVSGGIRNDANGDGSSLSGGHTNSANGFSASVSGGIFNNANGSGSSISGGQQNTTHGELSSVSGGHLNISNGHFSSVKGGSGIVANGNAEAK